MIPWIASQINQYTQYFLKNDDIPRFKAYLKDHSQKAILQSDCSHRKKIFASWKYFYRTNADLKIFKTNDV